VEDAPSENAAVVYIGSILFRWCRFYGLAAFVPSREILIAVDMMAGGCFAASFVTLL